jgi:hypothetical protein
MVLGQSQGPIRHLSPDKLPQGFMQDALEPPKAYANAQDGDPLR